MRAGHPGLRHDGCVHTGAPATATTPVAAATAFTRLSGNGIPRQLLGMSLQQGVDRANFGGTRHPYSVAVATLARLSEIVNGPQRVPKSPRANLRAS